MAISNLPPEVLTNIFLRLDLKTLSSTRLVKKSWLQFISSPDFAKTHLKNSKEDHGIIFITNFSTPILGKFSIAPLSRKSYSIDLVNFDHPKMRSDLCLIGSCNGLVCIITKKINVTLWNPCTGEHKELSPLVVEDSKVQEYTYGFGYDESTDDYKVVVLCYTGGQNFLTGREMSGYHEVKVNTLKTNYWKTSGKDFKGRVLGLGKFASGKIHWLVNGEFGGSKDIISFDLRSGIFGTVEQPSYGFDKHRIVLDVMEGCICLLSNNDLQKRAKLWIMKEYGVNESWKKVVTISSNGVAGIDSDSNPRSMLPNREILFSGPSSFKVYNPEDDSFRFTGIVKKSLSQSVTYVPSFVSPRGY